MHYFERVLTPANRKRFSRVFVVLIQDMYEAQDLIIIL